MSEYEHVSESTTTVDFAALDASPGVVEAVELYEAAVRHYAAAASQSSYVTKVSSTSSAPPCGRCGDTDRFSDHGDSVCSTCGGVQVNAHQDRHFPTTHVGPVAAAADSPDRCPSGGVESAAALFVDYPLEPFPSASNRKDHAMTDVDLQLAHQAAARHHDARQRVEAFRWAARILDAHLPVATIQRDTVRSIAATLRADAAKLEAGLT